MSTHLPMGTYLIEMATVGAERPETAFITLDVVNPAEPHIFAEAVRGTIAGFVPTSLSQLPRGAWLFIQVTWQPGSVRHLTSAGQLPILQPLAAADFEEALRGALPDCVETVATKLLKRIGVHPITVDARPTARAKLH